MKPLHRRARSGFTLAEVAVTIVIVGIGLLLVLQGLNTAKLLSVQTRNYKLAHELALLTLGQVESGLYQEDIEDGLVGTYAEEGYPDFAFEVVVGDEAFREQRDDRSFDSWAPRESDEDDEDEEDAEEPFEKVRVRVVFPKVQEVKNELVLERWIPWTQVYGESETAEEGPSDSGASPPSAAASGPGSGR